MRKHELRAVAFLVFSSISIACYAETNQSPHPAATYQELPPLPSFNDGRTSSYKPVPNNKIVEAAVLPTVPKSSDPTDDTGKGIYESCVGTTNSEHKTSRYFEGALLKKRWLVPPTDCGTPRCVEELRNSGTYILQFDVANLSSPLSVKLAGDKSVLDKRSLEVDKKYAFCAFYKEAAYKRGTLFFRATEFYQLGD